MLLFDLYVHVCVHIQKYKLIAAVKEVDTASLLELISFQFMVPICILWSGIILLLIIRHSPSKSHVW